MTDLSSWTGCNTPIIQVLDGQYARLEPYDATKHGAGLFTAIGGDHNDDLYDYLMFGPYTDTKHICTEFDHFQSVRGFQSYVIFNKDLPHAPIVGIFSILGIREMDGACELGAVIFGKDLQRTRCSTEAFYLITDHIFAQGYRRYEWKANNDNIASKRAASRYGFSYEGVFRQDKVSKGKNRDTAWYAMIDSEWPLIKPQFEVWLAADNFGENNQQKTKLEIKF